MGMATPDEHDRIGWVSHVTPALQHHVDGGFIFEGIVELKEASESQPSETQQLFRPPEVVRSAAARAMIALRAM